MGWGVGGYKTVGGGQVIFYLYKKGWGVGGQKVLVMLKGGHTTIFGVILIWELEVLATGSLSQVEGRAQIV